MTNLEALAQLMGTLAKAEPIVAEHVLPIVQDAFVFAMSSGDITNPDIWVRAFKAAALEVETKKIDDTWLSMTRVES